ncbi:phage integrase SAM-like domain-containing protein [Algibacter sp.]|nr:phage integrase SAM-like domain-containing protein [Algibacter sp.]
MAALTFSYRSDKHKANLEARLSFRINGENKHPIKGIEMPYSYYTRTEIETTKTFWQEYKKGKKFRDGDKANEKEDINKETQSLRTYVIAKFNKVDTSTIDKNWLKNTIHNYYNPPEPEEKELIPHNLFDYWDYYLNIRANELSDTEQRKFKVTKRKVQRYQKEINKTLAIIDINDNFKKNFLEYCDSESYALSTIKKDLGLIKRVCMHARTKGIETSPELENLKSSLVSKKVEKEKIPKIYLSFDELDKIKAVKGLPDYLKNVRDWIIISCYTGQRVSDFMRFNKSMIRIDNGIEVLDITQVKTGKNVTIPLLPEVISILDKRNGEFPHAMSDQRYNEWIKLVCKRAKISNRKKGRLTKNINPNQEGQSIIRNVLGTYPKWQLVSSHVGRRSFCTNYYGKIATTYIKNITAHSTEAQLLTYIGKGSNDTALDAYKALVEAKI